MATIFEVPMDNGRTRYQAVDESVNEVRNALFRGLPGALGRGAIDLASLAQLPPELSEENTNIGAYMFTSQQAAALLGNAHYDNLLASSKVWNINDVVKVYSDDDEMHSGRFIDRNGYSATNSTINPDGTLSVQPKPMWDYDNVIFTGEVSEPIVNAVIGPDSGREAVAVWAHEVTIDEVGVRKDHSKGVTVGYMDEHNTFSPQVTILDSHRYSSVTPFESRLNPNVQLQSVLQRNDR